MVVETSRNASRVEATKAANNHRLVKRIAVVGWSTGAASELAAQLHQQPSERRSMHKNKNSARARELRTKL